jgi:hypothetical protein
MESIEKSVEFLSTFSMNQITEVFETPKRRDSSVEIEDDDDNYENTDEGVEAFGRRHFGEIDSPMTQ